ncbi:MAG TPA: hypothetical protein VFD06_09300 [Candidatus Polarisedimenticolia bacterium]|nr:hypothetical protein [Candidatus Polarisedimenticolia bacterium]
MSIGDSDEAASLTRRDIKKAVKEAVDELLGLGETRMAGRFEGGTLIIRPGKADTQEKVIPVDALFHKITMVRDRLRVLEQRLNTHPKLNDEDRVELQQYVTRCYGSLTSFNVLFRDRDEWFIGSRET